MYCKRKQKKWADEGKVELYNKINYKFAEEFKSSILGVL